MRVISEKQLTDLKKKGKGVKRTDGQPLEYKAVKEDPGVGKPKAVTHELVASINETNKKTGQTLKDAMSIISQKMNRPVEVIVQTPPETIGHDYNVEVLERDGRGFIKTLTIKCIK